MVFIYNSVFFMDDMCSVWQRSFNQWYKSDSLIILTKAKLKKFANAFAWPLYVDNVYGNILTLVNTFDSLIK